jgi:hypothetical protein
MKETSTIFLEITKKSGIETALFLASLFENK